MVENYYNTMKKECTDGRIYLTSDEYRMDIIDFIVMFYNSHRLHLFLGYRRQNDFKNI